LSSNLTRTLSIFNIFESSLNPAGNDKGRLTRVNAALAMGGTMEVGGVGRRLSYILPPLATS